MPTPGSGRFRWIFVCLALASPVAALAQGFTFDPPPCQGNVFNDVNCSGLFDAWIEQYARDAITGGCGGGNYCPNSAVTRGQMAVFVEKAMRGSSAWPPQTVLVHAILNSDGSLNANASGQALLDAVAAIPTNATSVPTPANPWLIKVGPGTFNLGNEQLVLPDYVTLQGSGFASPSGSPLTVVTAAGSNAFTGTIVAGPSSSEIHDLGVRSTGGTRAIGISNGGGILVLDHVFASGGGANGSYAVYSTGGELTVNDSVLSADGNGVNSAMSLYAEATTVRVERSVARVSGATNSNGAYGVYVVGGSLDLTDSKIESNVADDTPVYGLRLSGGVYGTLDRTFIRAACNGSGFAYGAYPQQPTTFLSVRASRIEVSGSGCEANAIRAFDSTVEVLDSYLSASGATSNAIKTTSATGSPSVRVHRSSLIGVAGAIDNAAGFVTRVGGSGLFGGVTNAGTLLCINSYHHVQFTALNPSCQ
jgi:hypothetical protein